eukprot:GFUD01115756.1.p1 GENE.GFUD01115756.1~~GFUD01115756.1.p1  ORF type:complete len:109 (+),score=9.40 GFUD01115756.1:72-398(+)
MILSFFVPVLELSSVMYLQCCILDLESVIFSKMSKNSNGEWQCNDCFKTSKVKTNIYVHIEANHVESPGYQCDVVTKCVQPAMLSGNTILLNTDKKTTIINKYFLNSR